MRSPHGTCVEVPKFTNQDLTQTLYDTSRSLQSTTRSPQVSRWLFQFLSAPLCSSLPLCLSASVSAYLCVSVFLPIYLCHAASLPLYLCHSTSLPLCLSASAYLPMRASQWLTAEHQSAATVCAVLQEHDTCWNQVDADWLTLSLARSRSSAVADSVSPIRSACDSVSPFRYWNHTRQNL